MGATRAWFNSRSWALVDDVPISLSQGSRYESGDLAVNLAARHDIEVYAENNIDPEKLECLLGVRLDPKLCDTSAILRAYWVVANAGKTVSEGESDDTVGFGGGGSRGADRTIGTFRGEKGHRYKLTLDILSDTGDLNFANPRLYVGVNGSQLESTLFITGFIRFFCEGIIAIGCLMLIGSFVSQRQSKRGLSGVGR
jgi:hypothetical protein